MFTPVCFHKMKSLYKLLHLFGSKLLEDKKPHQMLITVMPPQNSLMSWNGLNFLSYELNDVVECPDMIERHNYKFDDKIQLTPCQMEATARSCYQS